MSRVAPTLSPTRLNTAPPQPNEPAADLTLHPTSTAPRGPLEPSRAIVATVGLSSLSRFPKWLRRTLILISGLLVIASAAIVGPLPGPGGTILVVAGLGILATEFEWARRILHNLRDYLEYLGKKTDALAKRTTIFIIPFAVALYVAVWSGAMMLVVRMSWPLVEFVAFTASGLTFPFAVWLYRLMSSWWMQRKAKKPAAASTASSAASPV